MQLRTLASERRAVTWTGLDAARVGAVNTGVLLFTGVGTVPSGPSPLSSWASVTFTANGGTRAKISKRGLYQVNLTLTVPASGRAAAAIAYDAPDTSLVATVDPLPGTPGVVVGAEAIAPASTQIPICLSTVLAVTDADAGDPDLGVVRFLANNPSGPGALGAGDVLPTVCRAGVRYLCDLLGG